MSTAVARNHSTRLTPEFRGHGVSDDSKVISLHLRRTVRHRQESLTQEAHFTALANELAIIANECALENWDGYNAQPISPAAIREAIGLLYLVRDQSILPDESTAEPDGSISLDWYGANKKVYSISVNGKENLVFSGRFPDGGSLFGVEVFSTILPKAVTDSIARIKNH